MLLEDFLPTMNSVIENLSFGSAEIVMAVTDATNPKNICIYTDNGIYSSMLTVENAEFTGKELLKAIDFTGLKLAFVDYEFDNHTKWCCPYWLILELQSEFPNHYSRDLSIEIEEMIESLREQLL